MLNRTLQHHGAEKHLKSLPKDIFFSGAHMWSQKLGLCLNVLANVNTCCQPQERHW